MPSTTSFFSSLKGWQELDDRSIEVGRDAEEKAGRVMKAARVRGEQWHALLAQKGLRKEIKALQAKHHLPITGVTVMDQRDKASVDSALVDRLNQRNADINDLRKKYDIPDDRRGDFWCEVVLEARYRNPRVHLAGSGCIVG